MLSGIAKVASISRCKERHAAATNPQHRTGKTVLIWALSGFGSIPGLLFVDQ